jgi:2-polyprenyl-3-methyl-5-hydroxy-6-metoxy-1,4-benzoquinol methylase
MSSKDERDAAEHFKARYGAPFAEPIRRLERLVLGADFGGNGYTTVAQAELLGERLDLSPTSRLLDIGAGRGWPGLYLAQFTGCHVVVTDLPHEAMHTARERAREEALSQQTAAVVASARRLPFGAGTFDAIVHTDVLC